MVSLCMFRTTVRDNSIFLKTFSPVSYAHQSHGDQKRPSGKVVMNRMSLSKTVRS